MVEWLERLDNEPSDLAVWGTTKSSYTIQDLNDWISNGGRLGAESDEEQQRKSKKGKGKQLSDRSGKGKEKEESSGDDVKLKKSHKKANNGKGNRSGMKSKK